MINMFYNGSDSFSPLQEWNQCLASIDIKVIHPQAEKNNCLALHKYDNNITTLKTVGWEEADCTTTWHESHPFKTAMDLMLNFLKTWLTVTTWLTVATWRKTKPVRMIDGSHKSRCLFRRIPLELSLQSIPLKYNCITRVSTILAKEESSASVTETHLKRWFIIQWCKQKTVWYFSHFRKL